MKKIIKLSKKTFAHAGRTVYSKAVQFAADQRGAGGGKSAVGIFEIFVGVVIIIVLFAIFKEQLSTFVQTKIFGKMNSIE